MSKTDKNKFLYLISISLILFLAGCVDTGVQNIPESYDFHSQLKLVNITSATNAQSVTVLNSDGIEVGSYQIGLGAEYPAEGQAFMDIPSGSKTFIIHFNGRADEEFKLSLESERKIRLYVLNPDAATTSILKSDLRYTWQEKNSENGFYPDSAFVSFINGSIDSLIASITISGGDADTTIALEAPLENGDNTNIMLKAPANYTISFKSPDDVLLSTVTLNANGLGRYTAVLYGMESSLASKVYTDD